MPNRWTPQNNFIGGEWGPDLLARNDIETYARATSELVNYWVLPQGGVVPRFGTSYIAEVKNSAHRTRLLPFSFNVEQSYVLEAGDQYFRFYTAVGRLEVAAVPVELSSPYTEAQIFDVHYTQSADVLYLVHGSVRPKELRRTSATTFTIQDYAFENGPFQDFNGDTTKTLSASALSGTGITVTAVGHSPFTANHVGSIWAIGGRTGTPKVQGYVEITAFTDVQNVTADVIQTLSTISATDAWAAPAWSDETGWPTTVRFHDGRLVFAGAGATPQHYQTSVTGEPNNLSLRIDDVVTADSSVVRELLSEQVNRIRWLASLEDLFAGTSAGWWRISAPNNASITPSNVTNRKRSTKGVTPLLPVIAGETIIYTHRAGKRVYGIEFDLEQDRNVSRELTAFNQQVTGSGLVQLSFEDGTIPLVWCVRTDGVIATCTYDLTQRVVAWSRQITDGLFKSVMTVPRATDEQDLTWVIVERQINGSTVQYVEVFDEAMEMDSALSATFGSPTSTVTGLDHLEGKTVEVKVDGARTVPQTVVGGQVTGLAPAGTSIVAGLPFEPSMTLLPPVFDTTAGSSRGRFLKTAQVVIDQVSGYGLHVNGVFIETRLASDATDAAPVLRTQSLTVQGEVLDDNVVTISQPFPFRTHIRAVDRYIELEDD